MKHFITLILLFAIAFVSPAAPRRQKKASKKAAATTKVAARPRTSGPFIVRPDAPEAPQGLDGRNIALWQSHGRYYDNKEERWTWQRARLMGTVEDLFPQAFVLPFLAPMLENAGAYVMIPRERDLSATEVIVDRDGGLAQKGYNEKNGRNSWTDAPGVAGFAFTTPTLSAGANPFRSGGVRQVKTVTDSKKASKATWNADIPEQGEYAVYVSYASLPESATDARYTINSLRGSEQIEVNQTMGGGTWIYLGTYPFAKGTQPAVELVNVSRESGKTVTADAVKIGGGMGNVARGSSSGASVSGYPRFTEGARYWMQWAGIPASVYSVSGNKDDYEDDYKSRGMWVNYLAGGSKSLPGEKGLGIPVDLSFAFHTDAGTTSSPDNTVGTLPIISTKGGALGNGKSRKTSARFAEIVTDQVVEDIQAMYDPSWNRRKMRDKTYHEAREPMVPAMLIELLSHQNFADMRYGLDPTFRFNVSRAIYKGMLKYLHETEGSPYVVTPLPVHNFAIDGKDGRYTLSWKPTVDNLEPTAVSEYYIVYERIDSGAFTELAVVDDPYITVTPTDSRIYSYRIVAANDGGISFPSETLALCDIPDGKPTVMIVNGFTRVSGPAEVYRDGHVGFDYSEDHGVPYIRDIHYTGEQTEFRPDIPWTTNDAPGHGASRATHETEIIAGNTFDFVYIHGEAIKSAGHSFISSSLGGFLHSIPSVGIIDLILGKQKEITVGTSSTTRYKPFTADLCQRLTEFCDAGGALFVSGSYIGSDLFDNHLSMPSVAQADRNFARSILGIEWRQAKATVTGKVREVKSKYTEFPRGFTFGFNQTLNADCYAVESPESFAPASPGYGAPVLRYMENDYVAGTAYDSGVHRTVVIGFPFETIDDASDRATLMRHILAFFDAPAGSHPMARIAVFPETLMANEEDALAPRTATDNNAVMPRDPAETVENNERRSSRGKRRRS